MFNKQQAIARQKEIAADVRARLDNGTITKAFMNQVEAETAELEVALKNHSTALKFREGMASGRSENPGGFSNPSGEQRMTFKGMGASFANRIVRDDGFGAKLAGTGAAVVEQSFVPGPLPLGQPATSLLDVLPAVPHDTPEFAYLRQTLRTNAAAIVPDYSEKPESTYTILRIENSLKVVAHMSESVPRYWLLDNPSLQAFINSELEYGLRLAVEAMVLTDIGTATPQTQDYETSALTTLRKAITKLELAGHEPSAIVVHPSDWQDIELALSSTNAIEHLSLPFDAASRRLFGVPIVASISETQGVAHILGKNSVALDTDRGVQIVWSETSNDTDFAENLTRARCESRYATSVFAPLGIVIADIDASGS